MHLRLLTWTAILATACSASTPPPEDAVTVALPPPESTVLAATPPVPSSIVPVELPRGPEVADILRAEVPEPDPCTALTKPEAPERPPEPPPHFTGHQPRAPSLHMSVGAPIPPEVLQALVRRYRARLRACCDPEHTPAGAIACLRQRPDGGVPFP